MTARGQHLDDIPLDELCKPISARTPPRAALVTHFGMSEEISVARAIAVQRMNAGSTRAKRRNKAARAKQ